MDILVLGGTRMMGKHLVKHLLAMGHVVTLANRGLTPDEFGTSVHRIRVDRTDEQQIQSALSTKEYDMVYDSLAYCSNDVKKLLDWVKCKRYITISTASVYNMHVNTKETAFDPLRQKLIWCNRADLPYHQIKQQAECALAQTYAHVPSVAVRLPFVIGKDDYTKRLQFYVNHIMGQKPMYIDNLYQQMAFVRSDDAGRFLATLSQNDFTGAINAASDQTISISQIAHYIHLKTTHALLLDDQAPPAPYNAVRAYSMNTDKAKSLGFSFSPLHTWIYPLLDHLIQTATVPA